MNTDIHTLMYWYGAMVLPSFIQIHWITRKLQKSDIDDGFYSCSETFERIITLILVIYSNNGLFLKYPPNKMPLNNVYIYFIIHSIKSFFINHSIALECDSKKILKEEIYKENVTICKKHQHTTFDSTTMISPCCSNLE